MKKKYIVIIASILVIAAIVAFGQIFTVRDITVVFHNKTGLADESEVLAASGLKYRNNIFNVKEDEVKRNVSKAFYDNSITVTNIERRFPDKVVIYVKERIPIFQLKVSSDSDLIFVATDKDFQRGKIQKEEDLPPNLIRVTGYEVKESFDVKECVALRNIARALIDAGMDEEAIPYFIDNIDISGNFLIVTLKGTNARFRTKLDNAYEETTKHYKKYITLDIFDRNNAYFYSEN